MQQHAAGTGEDETDKGRPAPGLAPDWLHETFINVPSRKQALVPLEWMIPLTRNMCAGARHRIESSVEVYNRLG